MPNSDSNEMRLQRLEQSVVQITTILVEQSERTDAGFNQLHAEINTMREAITDRLDRLITVTVQARTHDIERFADIERRLARLEGRVGV